MKKIWIGLGILIVIMIAYFSFPRPESLETREGRQERTETINSLQNTKIRKPSSKKTRDNPVVHEHAEQEIALEPIATLTEEEQNRLAQIPTYTKDDGTEIRDHRKSAVSPDEETGGDSPGAIPNVEPMTLIEVRKKITPLVQKCMEDYQENTEKHVSISITLTTSIENEILQVDKTEVRISGLEDKESLVGCLTEDLSEFEQEVIGAADIQSHRMTFPYNFN